MSVFSDNVWRITAATGILTCVAISYHLFVVDERMTGLQEKVDSNAAILQANQQQIKIISAGIDREGTALDKIVMLLERQQESAIPTLK